MHRETGTFLNTTSRNFTSASRVKNISFLGSSEGTLTGYLISSIAPTLLVPCCSVYRGVLSLATPFTPHKLTRFPLPIPLANPIQPKPDHLRNRAYLRSKSEPVVQKSGVPLRDKLSAAQLNPKQAQLPLSTSPDQRTKSSQRTALSIPSSHQHTYKNATTTNFNTTTNTQINSRYVERK
jgi:hypothetical protein